MTVDRLLDPTPAAVEGVAGEADHMERVHHARRVRDLLCRSGFEPGEPVHRDHLHGIAPGLWTVGEPSREHLLGAAFDHIQQPGRAGAVPDGRQVDDHRDVLVAFAGVPPHVLVDPDRPHPVEPCRVVEQHALTFGQDRVVGRIPRHSKSFGDPGHGQVLHHDPFQRPGQGAPGQPGPRLGGGAGVLPPHVRAAGAPVPADLELQRGGSPAERFVRELPGHGIPGDPFATAAAAPPVRLDDAARDDSPVGLEPLADGFKSEFVETGERRQVRLGEVRAFGSASTTNRCHAIL